MGLLHSQGHNPDHHTAETQSWRSDYSEKVERIVEVGTIRRSRRESKALLLRWSSGWLYKGDLKIEQLGKQQGAVAQYLDTVDEVLFGGAKGDVRGWAFEKERVDRRENMEREARGKGRKSSVPFPGVDSIASESATEVVASGGSARRVASADMLDTLQETSITEEPETLETLAEEHDHFDYADGPSVDDNDLSRWAQRGAFSDGELSRTHALLVALLPASLLPHLPTSPDRADLLNALSSGQLLCVAYNIGVRQSRKPWGYINDESIHDIVALEDALLASAADGSQAEKGRKGWTFRRTDNLRLWGA